MAWIAPHYRDSDIPAKITIETLIHLFADRVNGWQLDIAEKCYQIPHSGYAVLSILFSYFEMMGRVDKGYTGTRDTRINFRHGFEMVFGPHVSASPIPGVSLGEIADLLYFSVRNALYHKGFVGNRIILDETPVSALTVIESNNNDFVINIKPSEFIRVIKMHFGNYVMMLLDPDNEEKRTLIAREVVHFSRYRKQNPPNGVLMDDYLYTIL